VGRLLVDWVMYVARRTSCWTILQDGKMVNTRMVWSTAVFESFRFKTKSSKSRMIIHSDYCSLEISLNGQSFTSKEPRLGAGGPNTGGIGLRLDFI
jgi:hypothetical protein